MREFLIAIGVFMWIGAIAFSALMALSKPKIGIANRIYRSDLAACITIIVGCVGALVTVLAV